MKLFEVSPELLEWDSNFFNFPIFKCQINSEFTKKHETFLSSLNAQLIYVHSKVYDYLIHSNSFSFIDRKVTLKKEITATQNSTIWGPHIEFVEESKINPSWNELIFSSGKESRFFCDKSFPQDLAEKLYIQWVQKALDDEGGYFITVRYNKKVAGFITFHCDETTAKIGLIAVSKNYYRKGLGTALLQETQRYMKLLKIKCLYVTTQYSNFAAVKLYESCGFQKHIEESLGHYWVK